MSITINDLADALRPATESLKAHVDEGDAATSGVPWDGSDWADYVAAFARPAVEVLLTNSVCPLEHFPPEGFETVDERVEAQRLIAEDWRREAEGERHMREALEVEVQSLQREVLNLYRQLYNLDPR